MRIIHPLSLEEAVAIRGKEKDSSYLSGGTAVLSLAGGVEASAVVDISTLVDSSISRDGKHIAIGGGATLEAIASGPVPSEAARRLRLSPLALSQHLSERPRGTARPCSCDRRRRSEAT